MVSSSMNMIRFTRRLGVAPECHGTAGCPELLELEDGDFAVIGADITKEGGPALPKGSGVGDRERMVRVPRAILLRAAEDLPRQ